MTALFSKKLIDFIKRENIKWTLMFVLTVGTISLYLAAFIEIDKTQASIDFNRQTLAQLDEDLILKINSFNIRSIKIKTILIISILSSIINSFFTNTVYYLSYEDWEIGTQFIQYIIGDLFGTMIIFYILKISRKMIKY